MEENLRSLADWVMQSPFLVPLRGRKETTDLFPNLDENLRLFHSFSEHFLKLRKDQSRLWRIGIEFEDALHALFLCHPLISKVERGIQCFPTGELDFLLSFRDDLNFRLHIEAAVKFYLCLDDFGSKDSHRFVGPEMKDTLGKKLEKMEREQLRRFLDQSALRALIPLSDEVSVESTPLVKGVLYYPWVEEPFEKFLQSLKGNAHPTEISQNHERGFWIREDRVPTWVESLKHSPYSKAAAGQLFRLKPKSTWIRAGGKDIAPGAIETNGERVSLHEGLSFSEPECFRLFQTTPQSPFDFLEFQKHGESHLNEI